MTETACNVCGGVLAPWLFMPIDAKKNEATPYSTVLRCRSCALGAVSPLPNPATISGFYDLSSYYTHGESHMPAVRPSFADRVLTKLAWWGGRSKGFEPAQITELLPDGASVCDIGCGDAQYLRQFRQLNFEVVGVDPDPSARLQANHAGILVLEGTAEDVPDPLNGAAHDLVIMTHSLEHCRDVSMAMSNAFCLTKPGGYCYIEVPNCAAKHFKTFTICSEMFDIPRHLYFFTPHNLELLSTKAGFDLVRKFHTGYVRNFAPNWRAWETEIARRLRKFDPRMTPTEHSFWASARLFLHSFWRQRDEKYDSIGLLLRRPS